MAGNQELKYKDCFVAYIDILGFESMVKRSMKEPELFACLTKVLNHAADLPTGTKHSRFQDADGNWIERSWRIQTRAFSDTIVIFMPVEAGSVAQVLFLVRYLHDRMIELGLTMRGAVTIGGMYWNEAWSRDHEGQATGGHVVYDRNADPNGPITLGPGLIEAYRLEDECAIYPRILVSDKLLEHLQQNAIRAVPIGPYNTPERPMTDFVRTDADGLHFLDLLHPDVMRNDTEKIVRSPAPDSGSSIEWIRDGNTHATVTDKVRALLESSLNNTEYPEKIRAKYEWLRSYLTSAQRTQATPGQNGLEASSD